ncbi:MAG: GAF domain-containing protein [Myxococcales bacterium FL481]|nr:MAG: GAF domain-containing protein [Myxococcales bacterium FL481]
MAHLQHTGKDGRTERVAITRRLTTIGSSPDCQLTLLDADVAPTHATLIHQPGAYLLESTSRSFPFFVGGKKLRSKELEHGDVIRIGATELTFSTVDLPDRPSSEASAEISVAAMRRLSEFSHRLLQPGDLEGLLNELIDQVVALTRASKGFLVLSDGSRYEIRVARNLDREPVDDPAHLLSDDIIREVITSRRPQIISDAYNDGRFQSSQSVINLRLCSVMCAPLLARGELLGLIYVGNNTVVNLFTNDQLEVLEVFAGQAALFIKNAELLNELRRESAGLAERLERVRFGSIIGACPLMIEVYKRVEKVANTDVTVLISGETGTGKELIAHEIHNRSPRSSGPFITVNCGAIPENLIESELFGHVKGAFTGAVSNQIGKFQAAHGGTVFLDEIGELPLALQVKLLRVLQERQVQRVGETKPHGVDIRIVAATNRDLRSEVDNGRFREDLYFRLNVIAIDLPPLRERGDDVLLIARYLLGRFAEQFDRKINPATALDQSAVRALMRFSWPGNIRQLENHVKKALVLSDGPTLSDADLDLDLPAAIHPDEAVVPLAEAREQWQREYINKILALNGGNRTKTARDLGVDPRTIFRHLEKEKGSTSPARTP